MKERTYKVKIEGQSELGIGESSLIPTYCCEGFPSYWVEFPHISEGSYKDKEGKWRKMPYGGYFRATDVIKLDK